jgi:hypothetical protein
MHHNVVVATYQFVDQTGVTNIALDQSKATLKQTLEGLPVSGVGQLVQHSDGRVRVFEHIADEVRADETRPRRSLEILSGESS